MCSWWTDKNVTHNPVRMYPLGSTILLSAFDHSESFQEFPEVRFFLFCMGKKNKFYDNRKFLQIL